jgi:hypothetical protein
MLLMIRRLTFTAYVLPRSGRRNGRRLQTEYASAAILVRVSTLVSEQGLDRRSARVPLQPTRLFVEAFDGRQFFRLV